MAYESAADLRRAGATGDEINAAIIKRQTQQARELLNITDTADFHNVFIRWPTYGGVYFQDRMEYRQIIVNAGLRLDWHQPDRYFDLGRQSPTDPFERANLLRAGIDPDTIGQHGPWQVRNAVLLYASTDRAQPPTKWALSPRLGVSHPITVDSKLFFNYGRMSAVPSGDELYNTQSGIGEGLEQFGNPWLNHIQTIQYEVGYERNFLDNYLTTGTLYFRDVEGDISNFDFRGITGGGPNLRQNGRSKDTRGFELSVRRARGKFLTGYVSYDFRVDRDRLVGYDDISDQRFSSRPILTDVEDNPETANPPFKARPIIKVGINVRTPLDYGGSSRLWKGGWSANLFFRNEGGNWLNYNPAGDQALRNVLNAQWIDERRVDLRISKIFDLPASPMLYVEVQNLLDSDIPYSDRAGERAGGSRASDAQDRVFELVGGRRDDDNLERYMEALGWTVAADGSLNEGGKIGEKVDVAFMPQRSYMFYTFARDIHFGLRLNF